MPAQPQAKGIMAARNKHPKRPQTGMDIDCGAHPLDVRPVTRVLLAAARAAVAGGGPRTPLVMLLTEQHDVPAQIAVQYAITETLKDEGLPFALGFELPHNMAGRTLYEATQREISVERAARFSGADINGTAALAAEIGFNDRIDAPVSNRLLADMCLRRGISCSFNDAADLFGDYLDMRDPATRRLARPDPLGLPVTPDSAAGMSLRNRMIVRKAMAHIKARGVPLYLQFCGSAHAAGQKDNFAYASSLDALFRRAGAVTLPVFYDTFGLSEVPAAALARSVRVHGLATDAFELGQEKGEAAHLSAVFAASGIRPFAKSHDRVRDIARAYYTRKIVGWMQQAGLQVPLPARQAAAQSLAAPL